MFDGITEQLAKECRPGCSLWIGGAWVPAVNGATFPVEDPATVETLWEVSRGTQVDVDKAVVAAQKAFPAWCEFDGIERGRILRRAADLIRAHAESFGIMDTRNAGRPIRDTTHKSAGGVARLFDFYAGLSDKLRGQTQPVLHGYSGQIDYEPYGVVGAISPWNYPLSNAATKIAPALACGNSVVLKPAEQAPLSALLLADLLHQAGLPAGVLNIVTGFGAEAGSALVEHPAVSKISFTGSTITGQRIAAICGQNLKSVTLELGGKSANIVFSDADLDIAAKGAVFTAFNNSGQTCTAGTRLLVHESIREDLLDRIRREVCRLSLGNPSDPSTNLGPLISKNQKDRVAEFIALAEKDGLDIEIPELAKYLPMEGGFFQRPIIVHGAAPESRIAQEEIFGPVLTVFSFETDEEALELANSTEYGLAAALWTRDYSRIERFRRGLEAGVVWVNCVNSLHPGMPVSGRKNSGLGLEYGVEAMKEYMKVKSTVVAWLPWKSGFED